MGDKAENKFQSLSHHCLTQELPWRNEITEMKPSPHSYCHYSFKLYTPVPMVSSENVQGMAVERSFTRQGWQVGSLKALRVGNTSETARVRISQKLISEHMRASSCLGSKPISYALTELLNRIQCHYFLFTEYYNQCAEYNALPIRPSTFLYSRQAYIKMKTMIKRLLGEHGNRKKRYR